MIDTIVKHISASYAIEWVLLAVLACIILYKLWPILRSLAKKDRTVDSIPEQLRKVNARIDEIETKLSRDYASINDIKDELRRQGQENVDSLEERHLLMSSMLAVLEALSELGTNGVTKEAQKDLQEYINRKAHAGK